MTSEQIAAELSRLQAEFEAEKERRDARMSAQIIPFPGVKSLVTEQARRDRERVQDGFDWIMLLNDIALEPIREQNKGPEDAA